MRRRLELGTSDIGPADSIISATRRGLWHQKCSSRLTPKEAVFVKTIVAQVQNVASLLSWEFLQSCCRDVRVRALMPSRGITGPCSSSVS